MAERNRAHLKQEFRDGERPTGADFGDLMDSFLCKVDDQVSVTGGTLHVTGGLNIGAPATGDTGTIRVNGLNIEVFDGTNWNNVGGSAGAFLPVAGGPSVSFNAGNVGIGNFPAAPTFRLEVELGNNTAPADRVKFGNAVIANGNGAFASAAQFSHADHSSGNTNYALRQGTAGDVNLNAPVSQPILISHNRLTPRIFIAPTTGQVVIASNAVLAGTTAAHMLQVNGDAAKQGPSNLWTIVSDGRYKKDVAEFKDGLDKLMQVRPVRFRYKDLPGCPSTGEEGVGIIGQEMQQVFPYMVTGGIDAKTKTVKEDQVLMYNGSALTYVMVNAIQELATRVKDLEAQLEQANKKND